LNDFASTFWLRAGTGHSRLSLRSSAQGRAHE